MGRFAALFVALVVCLVAASPAAFASHQRGDDINLTVTLAATPGSVSLHWTGGQQPFSVFRSTTPQGVVGPGHFIGTTNEPTFDDTPPEGAVFFYEISGNCVYNPPEVCNGLDDDCDGTVDGPGSEASCNLPHAVAACAQGACAVAGCAAGWGDCNGGNADGCEVDLTTDAAHCGSCSTSCDDASQCTHDLCASSTCRHVDRKQCANANTPADPTGCGPQGCGACSYAGAFQGCPNPDTDGDGLADAWEDAQAIDIDCNGVYDGNDVALPGADKRVKDVYVKAVAMQNAPDETEPNLHKPTQEAVRSIVAAFADSHLTTTPVRCDATSPACPPGFTCSTEDFVCLPVCSTDTDCTTGVCVGGACRLRRLHLDYAAITPIPHAKVISYGPVQPGCMTGGDVTQGVNLYDLRANPANFDPKTALFTHFGVFGHFNTCDSPGTCADDDPSDGSYCPDLNGVRPGFATSGLAEYGGNDFVVSLGGFPSAPDPVAKDNMVSGTFMHELGHNLNLDHGGPSCDPLTDPTCTYAPAQPRKVNYISVMNYRYQFGIPVTKTPGSVTPDPPRSRLDFSQVASATLTETNLNESDGLGSGSRPPYGTDLVRYVSPGFGPGTRYGSTMPGEPINWKLDDPVISTPVAVNIDGFPPGPSPSGTQPGAEDWGNLDYDFQCSSTFLPGVTPPAGAIAVAELDPTIAADLDILQPLQVPRVSLNQTCVDLSSQGAIPVTVYGSATFDVSQIATSSLRVSEATPNGFSIDDVDLDGYLDLVVQAVPSQMSLTPQNHWVVVTGKLNTGQSFQGEVPAVVSAAGCCGPGQVFCATGCTDLGTDPDNCGACGASCSNSNMATRTCGSGVCNGTCLTGYGDCDGNVRTDGCETPLGIAQSTSPATIWAGDINPNKDLKPGYQRVTGIVNCGGCGVTCDDGTGCTTDLCVPVAQGGGTTGVCRHYDRGTCATARCGGQALPPGTPQPEDPACTAPDTDGDGLNDPWEQGSIDPYTGVVRGPGIDLDCDGEISAGDGDMVYSDPPVGPHDKDVYLKIAYMGPPPPPNPETGSHAPLPEAIDAVVAAFARRGITLHVDPAMTEVPHAGVVYFPSGFPPDPCAGADSVSFYDIKNANFDPKLAFTHRFLVLGHNSCYTGESESKTTGLAEIKGNDLIVSLGDFTYVGTPPVVHDLAVREQAGTLMHELGHTLGLDHGGAAGGCTPAPCGTALEHQKPNHISSMNYSYQLDGIRRSATPGAPQPPDPTTPWRVDFSSVAYGDLNESSLNEIAGLTGGTPPYDRDVARYYCPGAATSLYYAPGSGPIDWSCDGVYSPSVSADIDADGTLATLTGPNDWNSLDYRFQCQPTFANGVDHPDATTRVELSLARATARGLRALVPCQSNADCDDGNFCNGAETCTSATGLCHPGTPPVCDDLNPCTVDTCSTATNACQYDPAGANGQPCTGPQFCVVGTVCTNGVCGGGTPRNCEDGLPCTANACSEALHACTSSCTTAPCWTTPVGPGPAAAPASDSAFVPPGAPTTSFVIKGNSLYAIRNTADAGFAAGSVKWTWGTPTGSTLSNFPSPVPLSPGAGGGTYLFVGADDGFIYKVNAATGATTASADLRRTTCGGDKLKGTPAVQLYRFSNSTFQNEMDSHLGHAGDDLVIVATYDQCGDSTRNRIYALFASDLSTKMVFNAQATHKMDFASDACALDYNTNRIYCGTNQPAGGTQNTLWAIDSTNFLVVWSDNAGSIQNRPSLANGRLYATTTSGTIMAYDPAGSAAGGAVRLWSSPAVTPGSISRAPFVESRGGGWQNKILALDSTGVLRAFTDTGDHATTNWTVAPGPGVTWTSMVAVDPVGGSAYIGRSDGYVQMVNLSTGSPGATNQVGPPDLVFDPALDVAGGGARFNRLTVASGSGAAGSVAQFCTWPPPGGCTSDADCASQSGQCYASVCDLSARVCVRVAKPDGTSCDDGLSCTSSSACRSGSCQSDSYAGCQCVGTGDASCSAGQTCCAGGTGGGCRSLLTDPANCGSCGNVCPSDRTCSGGLCLAAPAACLAPSAATLTGAASQLSGADGLAFDRLSTAGSICAAYVSSYGYPSVSTIKRVDAGGGITSLNSPSPDSAPLNGVSVPSEGNQFFAAEVNRPLGSVPTTVPGLIEGGFSPAHTSVARTTTATFSGVPFAATQFDQGPVGPALDYQTYTSSASADQRVYLANWSANGDVYELRRSCPICSWTANPVPVAITPAGDRVTAIAFAVDKNSGPINHRGLYIGHGTTLSIYDLDGGTQSNIDLAAAQPPQTINAILNIVVHSAYGEIFVEVKNTAGNRFVLNIDAHDRSARQALDVQTDLHLPPPFVPSASSNDGRLVIMPDGQVLRWVPGLPPQSPAFDSYRLTR